MCYTSSVPSEELHTFRPVNTLSNGVNPEQFWIAAFSTPGHQYTSTVPDSRPPSVRGFFSLYSLILVGHTLTIYSKCNVNWHFIIQYCFKKLGILQFTQFLKYINIKSLKKINKVLKLVTYQNIHYSEDLLCFILANFPI